MRWTTWLWAHTLLAIDRLLGTHLIDRVIAWRQAKINQLLASLETVNKDLRALTEELMLYRLCLCLVELKARSESGDLDDWLFFDPQNDGDESLLDSTIECLVKPRLATIDTDPLKPGVYVYRLHPDWTAIITRLKSITVAPELMSWLKDQTET